jgi:hypothetical protein
VHIFVAIPAYDGKVCGETVGSLVQELAIAAKIGVSVSVSILPGCSLITHARNQLVRDFYSSGADRLMFIDADVAWEPGSLMQVATRDVELVGGAYRKKFAEEDYPVGWLDKPELQADPKTGLLEVAYLPGGFLGITRSVFDKLAKAHPDRLYEFAGHNFIGFFHNPITNGNFLGEDGAFCADWRAIGGKVWLDPELNLTHVGGINQYSGNIGNWLRGRM